MAPERPTRQAKPPGSTIRKKVVTRANSSSLPLLSSSRQPSPAVSGSGSNVTSNRNSSPEKDRQGYAIPGAPFRTASAEPAGMQSTSSSSSSNQPSTSTSKANSRTKPKQAKSCPWDTDYIITDVDVDENGNRMTAERWLVEKLCGEGIYHNYKIGSKTAKIAICTEWRLEMIAAGFQKAHERTGAGILSKIDSIKKNFQAGYLFAHQQTGNGVTEEQAAAGFTTFDDVVDHYFPYYRQMIRVFSERSGMVGLQDIIDTGMPSDDRQLSDLQDRITGNNVNKEAETDGDENGNEDEDEGSGSGPYDDFAGYETGAGESGPSMSTSKATEDWTLNQIMMNQGKQGQDGDGFMEEDEDVTELDGMGNGNGGVDWPTGGEGKRSKAMEKKEAEGSGGKKGIQAKERRESGSTSSSSSKRGSGFKADQQSINETLAALLSAPTPSNPDEIRIADETIKDKQEQREISKRQVAIMEERWEMEKKRDLLKYKVERAKQIKELIEIGYSREEAIAYLDE